MSTETLDKIYLEYSTLAGVKTPKEIELEALLGSCAADKEEQIAALQATIAEQAAEIETLEAALAECQNSKPPTEPPEPEPEPEPPAGKVIVSEDFASGVRAPFTKQLGGPNDTIQGGFTIDGDKYSRFRIVKTPGISDRARAQAPLPLDVVNFLDGHEYRVKWSMHVDPSWQPENNGIQFVTMQIHGTGPGPVDFSPPLTFREENGRFEVIYRFGDVRNAKVKSGTLWAGKLPRGQRLDYELHGRWVQAGGKGYLRLYEGGQLIGEHLDINNCYHRGVPDGMERNPADGMRIIPSNYASKLNLKQFPSSVDVVDIYYRAIEIVRL